MKKLVFAAFMLGALVLTIASCKKIDNPEPIATIDEAKTATIVCVAQVQLVDSFATVNGVTSNDFESVPDGTPVAAWVDSDDFPGVGNAGQDINVETTVSGGTFTITIPVPEDGASVTVNPGQFRANYITAGPNVDENVVFDASNFTVTLRPGQVEMRDITWN